VRGPRRAAEPLGVLTGTMRLPLLYLAALLLGVGEVAYDNAAQSILPAVVPPERLERANGTLWTAEVVMNRFVGPPLGGVLIGVGLAVPFLIDAGSFLASASLLLLLAGTCSAPSRSACSPRWRHPG
jgi:MFS family permease